MSTAITKDKIQNHLSISGESHTIELKKSTASLKSAAKTLCAFLNGQGGTVYIGISDNHKITGQTVNDKTKLDISNALKKFEPTANITVDYIEVKKDLYVIAMTANPDNRCIPYSFSGCSYERQQADTNIMSQLKYQQLLLNKTISPISWENQTADAISIDDLDHREITSTILFGIKIGRIDPSIEGKSKEPVFFEQAGTFVVRLWSRGYNPDKALNDTEELILPNRHKEILHIMSELGSSSSTEILNKMTSAPTDRTLRNDLNKLESLNLICRAGEGRGTIWKIARSQSLYFRKYIRDMHQIIGLSLGRS
ncbi:MAG: putative DNA binding domain-containing protein [Coxiellaceae bacterium]|nr:putative DNA binding domain-containing protein [Coxiellaceae bacterium]